jgi:hypothetical protein
MPVVRERLLGGGPIRSGNAGQFGRASQPRRWRAKIAKDVGAKAE